jgi:hypothetical protein
MNPIPNATGHHLSVVTCGFHDAKLQGRVLEIRRKGVGCDISKTFQDLLRP